MQQHLWWLCALLCLSACEDNAAGRGDSSADPPDPDGSIEVDGFVILDAQPADLGCQPTAELCNAADDDCDGRIDEDFETLNMACTAGEPGPCQGTGRWICAADQSKVECTAMARQPEAEICDGFDNDCDGDTDEGIDLLTDVTNCGMCGRTCEFDHAVPVCAEAVCEIAACDDGFGDANLILADGCECERLNDGIELCNQLDDDCDGQLDEDFELGVPCEDGRGECAAEGVTDCGPDDQVICTAHADQPVDEICNGKDDDCDGQIDEAFDADEDGSPDCGVDCEAPCPDGFDCEVICANQDCDDGDSTRHPRARDICEDGIDQNCSGADATCDGPIGRLDSLAIPQNPNVCRDQNGDGVPDNALGVAAAFVNDTLAQSVRAGDINLFAVALGWSGPANGFDLGLLSGQGVPPGPYNLRLNSVDEEGLPNMLFPGALADENGDFAAGPGDFLLNLPIVGAPLLITIENTTVIGRLTVNAQGLQVQNGVISGWVDQAALNAAIALFNPDLGPIIANILNADIDTDGDGEADALSACVTYTAEPAQLNGFPP